MENTLENKTVFISYCHDDINVEWIHKFVTDLGNHGIECIVDIYDLKLGQDLNYFMEQIKKVDKVLMLLGKNYKEKADNREGGVGTETQIISGKVYKDVKQTKFIPIVIEMDKNDGAYLPIYLESRLFINFSTEELMSKNIEELVNNIYDLPIKDKPKVKKTMQVLLQQENGTDSKKKSILP